jgi:hypothetical protein
MFTLLHLNTKYCGDLRDRKSVTRPVELFPKEDQEAIDIILDLSMGYDPEDQLNRTACTALDRDFYETVAAINTKDIDVAWRLTNNVNESWVMGPKVVLTNAKYEEAKQNEQNIRAALTKRGEVVSGIGPSLRSMSVGDILVDDGGVYHLCAPIGFVKLTLVSDEAKKKYLWE